MNTKVTKDQLIQIYETLINEIDIGVHAIDQNGKTVIYNSKMMEIESLRKEEVIDKDFLEVFMFEDGQGSTLLNALHEPKEVRNVRQTYFNNKGKEISTINNTLPVYNGNEAIGAIEIAKDVTVIERLIRRNMEINRNTRYTFDSIIGKSPVIQEVIENTKRATRTSSSVLIVGETGTGKELFAQSIHNGSKRASAPFISQNCAALPDNLVESLLFGTKKGAFTGATEMPGLFEQAEGGTLLLDEINSLSPMLQAKLLRAIQEKSIRRIGDTVDRKIDVRILSTINEDPIEAIAHNRLRKDLFYRLSVVSLFIPPLRERKEDIIPLINFFINKYNDMFQMNIKGVSKDVLTVLSNYDWPGNIRELEHVIEGAINLIIDEDLIEVNHLPYNFKEKPHHPVSEEHSIISVHQFTDHEIPNQEKKSRTLKEFLLEAEDFYINKALEKHNNHLTNAADELGLSRQTLHYRIKRMKR